MEYEIVTLKEKIAVGVSARTNNASSDNGIVIGGLWNRFFNDGIYGSVPNKANEKALGIYTDYAGDEKADYTVVVACEATEEPQGEAYAVCRIPAGPYAKFIVHGDMVQAVSAAWGEIWQMDLPRAFQCDFEEYQNDSMDHAEIHIYVGLAQDSESGIGQNSKLGLSSGIEQNSKLGLSSGIESGNGAEPGSRVESRCGILCRECGYREQMGCAGCVQIEKPFWGDSCPVKACCEEQQLGHCGQCGKFPCGMLNGFAYDEEQGDNGKRIEQCKCWGNP